MDPSETSPGALDWRSGLTNQLKSLGRWIEGRFVVEPDPSDEIVPAERYLDGDFLRTAITRARSVRAPSGEGAALDEELDLRIAVSRFTRQYSSSLSIVALTALAQGVGFNVEPKRCRMIVRSNVPFLLMFDPSDEITLRCAERPSAWDVGGPEVATVDELRAHVWRGLYAGHLAPLFSRVLTIAGVSPTLLWTNAAEWVGMLSDAADEYLDPRSALPFVSDRQAAMEADQLPGIPGPSPLRRMLQWDELEAPDFPHGVQVRQMCCLTYLLPDRLGRLCQNCGFLPLEDRVALIRERHGVAMGGKSGPAEQRSIQAGLRKIRSTP